MIKYFHNFRNINIIIDFFLQNIVFRFEEIIKEGFVRFSGLPGTILYI